MTDLNQRQADANAAKKTAMDQVEANASAAWSSLMLDLVFETCVNREQFTADDVIDRYDAISDDKPVTHEPRAFGPVMMRAAKLGWCRKANVAPLPSRRRSLHASPRAVWESLIYVSD
ncbi:hypothetical protein ABID65_006682 [Bradyrhizobium sp. S3.9.2]|uniref:hypothetical protein n=1 Tax=Bradyrhizobium sp. S3.9.2 TaxID=3156432 RepID=UPI0033946A56